MVDFEASLAKVVEQDGVVMSTPHGVKKRYHQKPQRAHKAPLFQFQPIEQRNDAVHSEDAVEKMDQDAVACIVRRHELPSAKPVKVNQREHQRSEFVVSLRDCFVPQTKIKERVPVMNQLAYARTLAVQPNPTSALTSQVSVRFADPWAAGKQLTGEKSESGHLTLKLLWQDLLLKWNVIKRSWFSFAKKAKTTEARAEEAFEEVLGEVRPSRFSLIKTTLGFVALVFLATLPAQALVLYRAVNGERSAVEQSSRAAVTSLMQAAGSSNLAVSVNNLHQASGKFRAADQLLDESRLLAASAAAVMPSQYRSVRALLEIGDKMSESGHLLAMGFEKIFNDPSRGLIERVDVLGAYARGVQPLLDDAERAAGTVDFSAVPEAQRAQAAELPKRIAQARDAVRDVAMLSDAMGNFLGRDGMRTYLLVFQNNTELRPSGGFMGSVAEVRVENGKITHVYVPKGGTYDLKGQLTERVVAPRPLQLVNPLWQFQDANWFADFPKTAEKIRWFWSKSGQPTLDGVVAVNASFMEKLLAVTGPIDMPEYGKTITADNFILETQKAVELEYDKQENTPKKIIGDLFDKMMERLHALDRDQWVTMAATASNALDTKEIQIAMFKPEEEQLVERFGWNGRLKDIIGDSLAVIGTNVAGQKTDAVVKEDVTHATEVQADGKIVDTLTIHRTHTGQKNELFRGVRNVQYLRVYVPKGSELLAAKGFDPPSSKLFKQPLDTDKPDKDLADIEKSAKQAVGTVWTATEDSRTVFGGWLQLDPGTSQDVILSYRLPFTVQEILQQANESPDAPTQEAKRGAYLLLLTSQSGKTRSLTHTLQLQEPWKTVWNRQKEVSAATAPSTTTLAANGWQGVWDRDVAVASLLSLNDATNETAK